MLPQTAMGDQKSAIPEEVEGNLVPINEPPCMPRFKDEYSSVCWSELKEIAHNIIFSSFSLSSSGVLTFCPKRGLLRF